jgi:hypothetical protein
MDRKNFASMMKPYKNSSPKEFLDNFMAIFIFHPALNKK